MSSLTAIRGAPKWARVTVLTVWVLVLIAGVLIGGKLALDRAYQHGFHQGFEAGVQASASAPLEGTAPEALRQAVESGAPVAFMAPADAATRWSCDVWVALPDGTVWRVPVSPAEDGTPLQRDNSTARGKYVLLQQCGSGSNEVLPPRADSGRSGGGR
ncbi:hypothetical protein C5U48_02825 [Mycolicibacter virginiensis]|uniref:Uncharacterized protein n=1 Tax=Mycolicibacter virginiensis TaxID=1795032 RepID=A0A9X7IQR7_9MYCO|nr:hypothetical protein [Mycolicibacter virginiensis]PQM53757.1 hypothetical protein C5U48_02825 [Mycolicibacter virginiensis]